MSHAGARTAFPLQPEGTVSSRRGPVAAKRGKQLAGPWYWMPVDLGAHPGYHGLVPKEEDTLGGERQ